MSHDVGHPPPKPWRKRTANESGIVDMGETSNIKTLQVLDVQSAARLIETIMKRGSTMPNVAGEVVYERVRQIIARTISDPNYAVFVTTVDRVPCLYTGGYITQEMHNYDLIGNLSLIIAPLNCYGKQKIRSTLRDALNVFTCWAFSKGAKRVILGHDSMIDHSDIIGKLMNRWGYTRIGEIYMMEAA